MALSEEQIVRYSRQLLLKEVGGAGQERLHGAITISGSGSAQVTAAAYLAAGGTALSFGNRPVDASEVGFLIEPSDVGKSLQVALGAALRDSNPDALVPDTYRGRVGELPASFTGPPPWVLMGWSGRRGGVVFVSKEGCAACCLETASVLSKGSSAASSVLLGALGALVCQRFLLGLSEPLGGVWLEEDGTISPLEIRKCSECR